MESAPNSSNSQMKNEKCFGKFEKYDICSKYGKFEKYNFPNKNVYFYNVPVIIF
jgi:hypothetical protein